MRIPAFEAVPGLPAPERSLQGPGHPCYCMGSSSGLPLPGPFWIPSLQGVCPICPYSSSLRPAPGSRPETPPGAVPWRNPDALPPLSLQPEGRTSPCGRWRRDSWPPLPRTALGHRRSSSTRSPLLRSMNPRRRPGPWNRLPGFPPFRRPRSHPGANLERSRKPRQRPSPLPGSRPPLLLRKPAISVPAKRRPRQRLRAWPMRSRAQVRALHSRVMSHREPGKVLREVSRSARWTRSRRFWIGSSRNIPSPHGAKRSRAESPSAFSWTREAGFKARPSSKPVPQASLKSASLKSSIAGDSRPGSTGESPCGRG